jgi:hypothetical protein
MKKTGIINIAVLYLTALAMMTSAQADAGYPEGGEVIGRHIFGLARDYQQSPVMIGEDPLIHRGQVSHYDFKVATQTYTVSLINPTPGSAYLSAPGADGGNYLDTHALDLEAVSGLTRPGAATKTPWGTLLFGESTDVDTAAAQEFVSTMAPFFKGKEDLVNPYHYGWLGEVVLLEAGGEAGEAKVIKDYGVGRVAASQILVMPDAKTLYLLDGQHSGNLYVFVAEQANSLTQGTLYGVAFDGRSVAYHELGQGAALKTKFRLRRASFDTFFDAAQPENGDCPAGFDYVDSVYGSECLKMQERSQPYVGLFEPIRMMALLPESATQKMVQNIKYDSASQSLSLVQADQQERTFPLKPHSKMQSQYIMEVSP